MKKPQRYQNKIDELDYKIVRLFEQRMCTVKKQAVYYKLHDLERRSKRKKPLPIIEKTMQAACDTEVVAYTEGLMMYMLTAAEKFYIKCFRR